MTRTLTAAALLAAAMIGAVVLGVLHLLEDTGPDW